MMAVHVATDCPEPDSSLGYGYQMWRSQHGWRAIGALGQLCLVLPDHDLVLAACAQSTDTQPMLDAVWEHLLPGVRDTEDEGGAERDEADDFFAGRALPTVASTAPPDPQRHRLRAVGPAAPMVAPDGDVVVRDRTVVIGDADGVVLVALGDGCWQRTVTTLPDETAIATAGTGGWTAPGVLEARIVPLCSPHVLQLRADVAAGTAELTWQVEPLGTLTLTGWH